MEDQPDKNTDIFGQQQNLPNATAVLVLGIVSIAGCWCYGLVGLACGIIALVLSGKDMTLYRANAGRFTTASYNNLKAGKICAIVGVVLSSLFVVYMIIVFMFYGAALTSIFSTMR
jgi:hypothetical protein